MFNFSFTRHFQKCLKGLDPHFQKQIREKLYWFSNQENPLVFAKKLKGYDNIFRFRSGNFRIVFELQGSRIILLSVKDRKDIYEGL